MKKLAIAVLVAAAVMFVACGKKKPDPEKFAEFCGEVIKCSKTLQTQPTGLDTCKRSMAIMEQKNAVAFGQFQDCVKTSKKDGDCLGTCWAKVMQQGISIPQ